MAYALRHTAKFYDIGDHLWEIEVESLDFTGSVYDVPKTGGTPLLFDFGETRRVPHNNPIFDTRATFTFESPSLLYYRPLFSNNKKEHRVTIKHKSGVFFKGFLVSDSYAEAYRPAPFFVKFQAIDGLILLKDKKWTATERMTLLNIINTCLAESGLSLNVRIALGTRINAADSEPELYAYHGTKYYADEEYTYWDVLEDILKAYGMNIRQVNGKWQIVQLTEQAAGTYMYTEFTPAGALVETDRDTININATQEGTINKLTILNTSAIRINPGYKNLRILQTLGLVGNMVKNSDFSKNRWIVANSYEFDDWVSTTALQKYYLNNNPYMVVSGYRTDGGRMPHVDSKWARQTIGTVEAGSTLQISFKYGLLSPVKLEGDIFIKLQIGNQWLGSRIGTLTNADYGVLWDSEHWLHVTLAGKIVSHPGTNMQFNEYSLDIPTIGAGGEVTIWLYQPANATTSSDGEIIGSVWDDISLKVIAEDGSDLIDEQVIEETIDENSSFEPGTIDVATGDAPNIPNATGAYSNIITKADGVRTSLWTYSYKGTAFSGSLLQMLAEQVKALFSRPKLYIHANIVSDVMRWHNIVTDTARLGSSTFTINRASFDAKKLAWSNVELLELYDGVVVDNSRPDGDWILEDGYWDDNGVWHDEDKTWKDEPTEADLYDDVFITVVGAGLHDISEIIKPGDVIDNYVADFDTVLQNDSTVINSYPYVVPGGTLGIKVPYPPAVIYMATFTQERIIGGVNKLRNVTITIKIT